MTASRLRILVIDDDRVIRQSIAAYLEDSGYQVLLAEDGLKGLEMFRQESPDLVVCDLRMPGLDGISVLHHISKEAHDTPIIVISGAGVMADVVEALRIGASDYLIKPILDLEVLEHAIERSMERFSLRKENAAYREELERANQELQTHLSALQQDQQAGRHVQRKMLPSAPQTLHDITFNHEVIPSLLLSGDFVEYVTVGEEHIVFMIADVSGHGASSAFVTVLLKNIVARARSIFGKEADDSILSPNLMLQKINGELLDTGIGKHITLVMGCIHAPSNALRYSIAGHLPLPILCSPDGVEYLQGEGMPVGMLPEVDYAEYETVLPAQFSLVMFSDGVLELMSEEHLSEKESKLLSEVDDPAMDLAALMEKLGLDQVSDAPDDLAVFVVSRGEAS
jgi:serine phosphatase RsbU (regulator of sigma subunit)